MIASGRHTLGPVGIRYILLPVLLVGLGSSSAFAQSEGYPGWFQSMPSSEEELWAVGYAPSYFYFESGVEEAKADAYERLRRAYQVTISGEQFFEAVPGGEAAFRGQDFSEEQLPDTLRSVSYADSAQVGGMTLVLAGWAPGDEEADPPASLRGRGPFSEEPPAWAQESDGDVRRAVGIAPRYYRAESSWQLAERRARRQIAFRAGTQLQALHRAIGERRRSIWRAITSVQLRHVQTKARWTDGDLYYVLVSGTVGEVQLE